MPTVSSSMMEIDQNLAKSSSPGKGSPSEDVACADLKLLSSPQQKSPQEDNHFSPGGFSPHNKLDVMNDFMQLGTDFVTHGHNYSDLLVWPEYPMELDIYSNAMTMRPDMGHGYASPGGMCNFIMLPPSSVLEYFLKSYVRSLYGFYPMIFAMSLDPNEMVQNTQAATLLVLLMIARGAAAVPMAEARYLSAGLTETCRISLFDIIEKDVELSADPIALRCALLFTLLGAWSGDKWQMDIAMGQRGMYLTMLKHAGMLEPQPSMIPAFNDSTSTELQWRAWMHRETQNRLVYNWVMVDQELSLFHDTAPFLSISELHCPLPGSEILWLSSNSEQWLDGIQSVYGCTNNCNIVLYHLISLNAVTNFPEIERLARREGFEAGGPTYWELGLRHKRCIYQREEAIFHCGQVLRLLRSIPADKLPPWWSTATYRVTLILWTDAIGRLDPSFKTAMNDGSSPESGNAASSSVVAVDRVTPEDPALIAYLWSGDGTAVLSHDNGSAVSMDSPASILEVGIQTIDNGISTRIGDGIKRKLATLADSWSSDMIGALAS
ncbi:putative transcription factor cmr1 [Diaporthe ampelina]|uniref:Putative transcription factor cmr1 n=1 Tax=Diaporthe ampelina TaxID=1214573 RepID=A0A0G2H7A6_9PEZI|nr:putative transcription factor cmr1 [Diaporthe ampelina]